MITEDYVNFEIAKLLKEKGFNEICSYEWRLPEVDLGYVLQKWAINNGQVKNSDLIDEAYAAPTLQIAMKWLREVHEIFIEIPIYSIAKPVLYRWNAFKNGRLVTDEEKPKNSNCIIKGDDNNPTIYYYRYEVAVEAALKYCLKNLI